MEGNEKGREKGKERQKKIKRTGPIRIGERREDDKGERKIKRQIKAKEM